MPQFYMHFIGGNLNATDTEGFSAEDADAALLIGVTAAGAIIAEEMSRGRMAIAFTLCLDDADGNRLGTLPVAASCAAFSSPVFTKGPGNTAVL
jgi:hypothetical protein